MSTPTKRQKVKYLHLTLCQTNWIFFFGPNQLSEAGFCSCRDAPGCTYTTSPHFCHLSSLLSDTAAICMLYSLYLRLSLTFHSFLNSLFPHGLRVSPCAFVLEQDRLMKSLCLCYELCFSSTLPCFPQDTMVRKKKKKERKSTDLILCLPWNSCAPFLKCFFFISNKISILTLDHSSDDSQYSSSPGPLSCTDVEGRGKTSNQSNHQWKKQVAK